MGRRSRASLAQIDWLALERSAYRHPLILGLFELLPPVDTPWPVEERVRWLRAVVAVLDVLYPLDSGISITVETQAVDRLREGRGMRGGDG